MSTNIRNQIVMAEEFMKSNLIVICYCNLTERLFERVVLIIYVT